MPGTQLSIFDMDFTSNAATKDKNLDKKEPSLDSNRSVVAKDITIQKFKSKIEKTERSMELTAAQQNFLDQNGVMKGENFETLSRIIICSCGWMAIEGMCKELNICSTTYINAEGKTESILEKKSSVLPADRIIYHKTDFEINEVQQQKLHEVKEKYQNKIKRIIHRHGDENVLIEVEGKLLDIIPNGWILEFTETTHVDCSQDEVLEDFQEDKKDVGKLVQSGDLVQATIGKSLVEGTITNAYGIGNSILNIDFLRNGVMFSTAIPRAHVKAILGKGKCVFWKYTEDSIEYFCPKCKKLLNRNQKKCECGEEINWQVKAMCNDKIKTS